MLIRACGFESRPGYQIYKTYMTDTNKETKVFNLCQELEDMKKRKKATNKGYNEEIKRIQAEIKDLIDPEEQEELP